MTKKAITDFTKSTDICNTYSSAYFWKGITYLTSRRCHLAFKNFEFILWQHPNHTDSLYYLGCIQKKLKKTGLAIQYFEKSIDSNPHNSFKARGDLANLYTSQEEYEKAIKYLKMLLVYDPDDVPTLSKIGDAYAKMSKDKNAIQYYALAIEKDDANRSYILNKRATAYYEMMRAEKVELQKSQKRQQRGNGKR